MIADVYLETNLKRYDRLPVLALCGFSGAGKTTLIQQLIEALRRRGLAIAVVKHDVHGLAIDRQGKDSDRFYKAGADVYMRGPEEEFVRLHTDTAPTIEKQVRQLVRRYDIVLVEGHKKTPLPKLWLLSENETAPPADIENVLAVLTRDQDRVSPAIETVDGQLRKAVKNELICGCVLIGGKSSRMGRPKHLISDQNRTWLERTITTLETICQTVVIAGAGYVPDSLAHFSQLPDAPDAVGPLAGILSAMRWRPDASWLVAACDMPQVSNEALQWLLSHRRPGVWAVIPQNVENSGGQPLLAYYHARCGCLMADYISTGSVGPSALMDHPKTASPTIPPVLSGAWRNINTPVELAAMVKENNIAITTKMR